MAEQQDTGERPAAEVALRQQCDALQAQLQAARAQLEALQARPTDTQVCSGYAHEMRNALNAARLPLAALLPLDGGDPGDGPLAEAGRQLAALEAAVAGPEAARLAGPLAALGDAQQLVAEMLAGIGGALGRGLAITGALLDFARVGHLAPADEAVVALPVVQQILGDLAAQLHASEITVDTQLPAELRLPMREAHAFAVLRNLLANARDALKDQPEPQPRRITVRAEVTYSGVVLCVEDTGVGISEEAAGKLFRPFYSTKGNAGTGLGLGLSRQLARAYGGELSFRSQPGTGTCFELNLPRRRGP